MLKDNVDTSTKDKDSIGCDVDMNITGNGSNGTRIVERIFSFIVYNKHLSVLLSIINNFPVLLLSSNSYRNLEDIQYGLQI